MKRLYGLDGLRGIAALMVFAHHLRSAGMAMPVGTFYLGVDVFFALSGFVMARTYDARLRAGRGAGMSMARFAAMRYRRLWAPAAIGSTIGLAICAWRFGISPELLAAFAAILLFLPAPWLPQGPYAINVPIWTLFVEVACNLVHALFLARASDRALAVVLAVCGAGFAGTVLFGMEALRAHDTMSTLLALPRGLASYVIGMLIWRKWGEAPLGRHPILAILAFPVTIAAFTALPQAAAMLLAVFVVSPLVLRASLSLGETRWASWLGTYSFPLYAVHMPLLSLVHAAGVPLPLAALLGLAAALLVTLRLEQRRTGPGARTAAA